MKLIAIVCLLTLQGCAILQPSINKQTTIDYYRTEEGFDVVVTNPDGDTAAYRFHVEHIWGQ